MTCCVLFQPATVKISSKVTVKCLQTTEVEEIAL